jgi:hypothetical protein
MFEKAVVLPDREEMLNRLLGVSHSGHMRQYFYPKLLEHAGEKKHAGGVAMMLTLAAADYEQQSPPPPGASSIAFRLLIPLFAEVLVDDSEVLTETKELLGQ